jgi:glyoxylate reductase
MKVYITRKIPSIGVELLKEKGYKVKVYKKDTPITQIDFIKEAKDADAVITLLTDKVDDTILSKLLKVKIISNFAVGYNNIDVSAASKRNIMVTNTPGVLTEATADTAFALLITCGRRIIESDKFMRAGKFIGWDPMLLLGTELKGKTIGIIGAGRIGTALAKRCSGFDMKIIYFSRRNNEFIEKNLNGKKVSLNKLLTSSDFISVHIPLNQETFHLIGKEQINLMKKSTVFINTARGEVVDEKELIKALKTKKIFSAGFDVYEGEPFVDKELFKLENVVLLPHIGSATFETRSKIAEIASKNVIAALSGKKPPFLVNPDILKSKKEII